MSKKTDGIALKATHDPRSAALLALIEITSGQISSQAALEKMLSGGGLVPSDKGLCTELVYGTLRMYHRLNWYLRRLLKEPEKLPAEMFMVLVSTAYEGAYMRSPDYATVNWAVGHIRNRFGLGLSKVANGVLRNFQRNLNAEYLNPEFYEQNIADELERIAIFNSMPAWIVRLWTETYGEEQTLCLLEASANAAPTGLRVNPAKAEWKMIRHNLLQEAGALEAGCYGVALPSGSKFFTKSMQQKGNLSRQSAAAQEILCFFTPEDWQGPVWDACAGRGGKTLALTEMGVKVELASDPSSVRLDAIPEEFARLGLDPSLLPEMKLGRAEEIEPAKKFGAILVDAPCSGLGTLARHPEIRLRRTAEDLENLAEIQRNILASVSKHLQPGGRIVYITCTLNQKENQEIIQHFLDNNPKARRGKEFQTNSCSPYHEFFFGCEIFVD